MPATATTRVPDGADASNRLERLRSDSSRGTPACDRTSLPRATRLRRDPGTRTQSADDAASSGSRSRPLGNTASSRSDAGITSTSTFLPECQMLKPIVEQHHRGSRIASRRVGRRDGDRRTRAPAHRAARAPASVARRPSSPRARARDSHHSRQRRHRSRGVARSRGSELPDADPCRAASAPASATMGVLPLPPTDRLPTLMTGRSRLRLDCGCRSYHERRIRATCP